MQPMENLIKSLSYLFYAAASVDNTVSPKEITTIHRLVDDNWKMFVTQQDPFGVYALEEIDNALSEFIQAGLSAETAFQHFVEMYTANKTHFHPDLKHGIMDICIQTANEVNRLNKKELVFLSRLDVLFKA